MTFYLIRRLNHVLILNMGVVMLYTITAHRSCCHNVEVNMGVLKLHSFLSPAARMQGSTFAPDPTFASDGVTWGGKKPIVWYGTSIEQGGVASRPGGVTLQAVSSNALCVRV